MVGLAGCQTRCPIGHCRQRSPLRARVECRNAACAVGGDHPGGAGAERDMREGLGCGGGAGQRHAFVAPLLKHLVRFLVGDLHLQGVEGTRQLALQRCIGHHHIGKQRARVEHEQRPDLGCIGDRMVLLRVAQARERSDRLQRSRNAQRSRVHDVAHARQRVHGGGPALPRHGKADAPCGIERLAAQGRSRDQQERVLRHGGDRLQPRACGGRVGSGGVVRQMGVRIQGHGTCGRGGALGGSLRPHLHAKPCRDGGTIDRQRGAHQLLRLARHIHAGGGGHSIDGEGGCGLVGRGCHHQRACLLAALQGKVELLQRIGGNVDGRPHHSHGRQRDAALEALALRDLLQLGAERTRMHLTACEQDGDCAGDADADPPHRQTSSGDCPERAHGVAPQPPEFINTACVDVACALPCSGSTASGRVS